ncbi:MAG: D-alanyl-D-alanine carboxypeptidase [Hydrogenophaga sp.]|nr:D-alanyl-D-alanine carboxypeptidase [Hydrogenophaga sp.]
MFFRPFALKSLCAVVTALVFIGGLGQFSPAQAASGSSAKVKKNTVKKTTVKKPVASVKKTTTRKVARSTPPRRVKVTIASDKVHSTKARPSMVRVAVPPQVSVGQRLGLHDSNDPLDLSSSVALVVDQETNQILFSKNDSAVLPIASLTKLMTGLVIVDAGLDMNESITITADDIDTMKGSRSRLAVGTTLTRGELMHLSLMSSENRAAHALGRTFPGGLREFVRRMNGKAEELGMHDTRYVEPTGLSSDNRSSARDLATLVSASAGRPVLRDLSTSPGYEVDVGRRTLQFNNSNRLVKNPDWEIGLQKTGYISEAGRCLVMQARVAGRDLIMVFLDASGKIGRLQDAERVRRWVEKQADLLSDEPRRPQG